MKLKFKTNAKVSEAEGKYYGGTDFKKGETYEMTGDQAKHWLHRHLADIVEEKVPKKKKPLSVNK